MIPPLYAAPATAAVALLGYWANRRVRGWLPDDPPGTGRKQHGRPMPLAGVLLLPVAGTWLGLHERWWLLAAVTVASVLGFVDDRGKEYGRDLGWRSKTIWLLLAAGLAATDTLSPLASPESWTATLLAVFALTNATNFLDNTDGVACALSATSLLLLGEPAGPIPALGWVACGFLFLNWPKPIAFLGDSGAYLLGVSVGAAAASAARDDWRALGPVAVQLADFVQVLIARLLLGVAPWIGDRRHLTHIVQNLGLPKPLVAPLFVALAIAAAAAARESG